MPRNEALVGRCTVRAVRRATAAEADQVARRRRGCVAASASGTSLTAPRPFPAVLRPRAMVGRSRASCCPELDEGIHVDLGRGLGREGERPQQQGDLLAVHEQLQVGDVGAGAFHDHRHPDTVVGALDRQVCDLRFAHCRSVLGGGQPSRWGTGRGCVGTFGQRSAPATGTPGPTEARPGVEVRAKVATRRPVNRRLRVARGPAGRLPGASVGDHDAAVPSTVAAGLQVAALAAVTGPGGAAPARRPGPRRRPPRPACRRPGVCSMSAHTVLPGPAEP